MIRPFESLMLRTLLGPLVAAMQLFAIYVVVHGHYSPGGGFQGGILLAASVILPVLANGRDEERLRLTIRTAVSIHCDLGVFIYALIGLAADAPGATSCSPTARCRSPTPCPGRHSLGILLIEIGVTIAVAGCHGFAIYFGLSERDWAR
jgi:multicomponent Na+:H+ antiporter subunit B